MRSALWFWDAPLEKRRWCYVQIPQVYEVAPCACGNADTVWSEFRGYIWCPKCEIDFIPEHNGVFDGPIPVATAGLLGMSFDRLNLETDQIEPFEIETRTSRGHGQ